ncbi:hypothetical protein Sango_2849800 [Sesamum angolense]|uniref:Reverse transcriptase zinc-binding domain-containing protein n=1 Tax=Sesamum angolense TaxID=2727404 RepID=A0AAE1W0B8_9LAMI|nr:hypothetical protein Sango_2849800 [Sesamum angolense]
MMATLVFLRVGCRWRIGMGHSVNIWKVPWIPRTLSFRVITPNPHDTRVLHVSDLILEDTSEWDVGVVNDLFWLEDRDLILQILLSLIGTLYLLVWHYSSSGLFFVKSSYNLALFLASWGGASRVRWCRNTSRVVWQVNIPNKAKFCSSDTEFPIHTLLCCSFAHQVWGLFGVHWYDIDSMDLSVEEWLNSLSLKLSPFDFSLVVMICWTIWWSRNLKCANRDFLPPLQVVDFAHSYLPVSCRIVCNRRAPSLGLNLLGVPPNDCVKINLDGRICDGGRTLGFRIPARNAEGSYLAWLSFKLDRGGSMEVVEAREAICIALCISGAV